MSRRHGKRCRAALERGDALLEHGIGRVCDARIDIAKRLQAEQRGGVIDVVEDEGRRLVDRRGACAGRRIWRGTCVDREGGKAGRLFVGHGKHPLMKRLCFYASPTRGVNAPSGSRRRAAKVGPPGAGFYTPVLC